MFDKEHVGAFLWNGKGMICRVCIPLSGREDEFLSDETVNVIAQAQELWYTPVFDSFKK